MKRKHPILPFVLGAVMAFIPSLARAHGGEEHGAKGEEKTISGEVVDMACYIDHGAGGEKHAACAKTCISSGLKVGIKAADARLT